MTGSRLRVILGLVLAVLLVFGAGLLTGRLTSPVPPTPSSESAAAGFLRDMQVHHAQAVEMALLVRDRAQDPVLRQIAYDIAVTQANQQGQMYGLLESWDLPQASAQAPMSWMSQPSIDGSDAHGHEADVEGTMPGLASPDELDALEAADGVAAERIFLTLMIAHHEGGIEMAEGVLARSDVPQVVTLATGIERSQRAEIEAMQSMLAEFPAA